MEVNPLQPEAEDAAEILRAAIDTADEHGPLVFEVRVWRRSYGPYLRYACRVERLVPAGGAPVTRSWQHPFAELDASDISADGCASNIVADNEATRGLLRLISLSDAELKDRCGTPGNNPARYRAKLLRCVTLLWD